MTRTVFCQKQQIETEGLPFVPWPGPLGKRVFADESDRLTLNAIIHPRIQQAVAARTQALEERKSALLREADKAALQAVDVTLPGDAHQPGTLHPITQLLDRAIQIFRRMGFALADGPDIETEWACFDALNTPGISKTQVARSVHPVVLDTAPLPTFSPGTRPTASAWRACRLRCRSSCR